MASAAVPEVSAVPVLPRINQSRLQFLKSVAPPDLVPAIEGIQKETTQANSKSSITSQEVKKLELGQSIADLSDEHAEITRGLLLDSDILSLRDIGSKYDNKKLASLLNATPSAEPAVAAAMRTIVPQDTPASIPIPPAVVAFQRKIFHLEPSAIIARMVKDDEIPIGSAPPAATGEAVPENLVKDGVVTFFTNNADFNIRNASVNSLTSDGKSLQGIPDHVKPEVLKSVKLLQTAQAITYSQEALPGLVKAGMTSAFVVSQVPEAQFVASHASELGGESMARDIHVHATNVVIRNNLALTSLLQTVRGSGVAMIDGPLSRAQRIEIAKEVASDQRGGGVNLEDLFGSLEVCACDDCNSVTSPAAYFVELLQYLRNNNLDPANPASGQLGYAGTPLEILLRRRPDLADLELTCANTNTVLPYIDLANEVMESFIVHMNEFATSSPKQATLDVFNADPDKESLGGSSPELLAQPQNTNDKAYCILKEAVYPSTKLPFHQPVEAIRLYLEFLQTNRADLAKIFRKPYTPPVNVVPDPLAPENCTPESPNPYAPPSDCDSSSGEDCSDDEASAAEPAPVPLSSEARARLSELHDLALSRADDAERLLLTEEEYVILTKEAFWVKEYFDLRHGTITARDVYQQRIGVKPDYGYWGVDYMSVADMLDQDETKKNGLTFVKLQFLPRTGLEYAQLVDLLRTDFINPNMPKGRDKVILQSFRMTYKLTMTLAPPLPAGHGSGSCGCHPHKSDLFKRLVDFMLNPEWRTVLATLKLPDTASIFDQEDLKARQKRKCADPECESCRPPRCRIHCHDTCQCRLRHQITRWLCKNFDKLGKIIVLESTLQLERQAQFLRFEADLVKDDGGKVVGHVARDGKILATTGDKPEQIGTLKIDGSVTANGDGEQAEVPWFGKFGATNVVAKEVKLGMVNENSTLALIEEKSPLSDRSSSIPIWSERLGRLVDDCDIRKDRLKHLDGTSLCAEEFDRMHRFIRLWRKLGWSMVELDVALSLLGVPSPAVTTNTCPPPAAPPATQPPPVAASSEDVDWTDFIDDCEDGTCEKKSCNRCQQNDIERQGRHHHHRRRCRSRSRSACSVSTRTGKHGSKTSKWVPSITPNFLHQLVALKKLAEFTGLPLLNLFAFWGRIATTGSPSLYSQLFLTHNLLGIDQVFKADTNDDYLAASPLVKMEDHIYILLATFGLKILGYAALTKMIWPDGGQDLTLDTVSTLYRYVLLGRILGVKPDTLNILFDTLYMQPFTSATKALELVELWKKITDAGFTFPQLRYVLKGTQDPLTPPVGPPLRAMLQASTTLYTGLNDIDAQHPDISSQDAATSAAVLSNTQLLFSADVAAQIAGFLDGTLPLQTKAPSGLTITIPTTDTELAAKLKYTDGENPMLQSTGQLTEDEKAKAKRWSASMGWTAAVDRLSKRAATFIKSTLSTIFPPELEAEVKATLLVGDVSPPSSDSGPDVSTGAKKRFFFLTHFIPYLRRELAEKLIVDTMSSPASLNPLVTLSLLTSVISVSSSSADGTDSSASAMQTLQNIKNDPPASQGFKGYLIPDTTDSYILVGESTSRPADIMLNGTSVPLDQHSEDDEPPDMWASKPLLLQGGRLYAIGLKGGLLPKDLSWKTDRTQLTNIPASALLGDHVTNAVQDVFESLFKCAIIINGFSLSSDEVLYFQSHAEDFGDPTPVADGGTGNFDWNKPTLATWKRLADYSKLKKSLPKLGKPLIDLFNWMSGPDATGKSGLELANQIDQYTLWSDDDVSRLIDAAHFDLARPSSFRNEINLLKLQEVLDARIKIGVNLDLLFLWAPPRIDFWKMRDIRESIRVAIRAQFKLSDWEIAIKPTHDKLRQLQSDALTAYLINQPALKDQQIVEMVDADSLFEFLLIDNQMCPCMETARLKQATSSVQLFVQRCMLGLEPEVPADKLDRGRWDWMQRYRVWEANRKVYLYPENWIQPSLRDDKSPIYTQLESELHQSDLDTPAVLDAMKDFLFRLDDIGNLEVNALFYEDAEEIVQSGSGKRTRPAKIHIFARTRAAPYRFYYRMFNVTVGAWQPWQDMTVDIPRYEIEKPRKSTNLPAGDEDTMGPTLAKPGGHYLVPFTFNSRLFIALPQFEKVQLPAPVPHRKIADLGANMNADETTPIEIWEIKMGISELRNGRWTPKQTTSAAITEAPQGNPAAFPTPLPHIGSYKFISRKDDDGHTVYIDVYRLGIPLTATDPSTDVPVMPIGRFSFTGSHFGVADAALDVGGATMKWSNFHFQGVKPVDSSPEPWDYRAMYPIQTHGTSFGTFDHEADVYVKYPLDDTKKTSTIKYSNKPAEEAFYHPFVHDLLDRVSRTDNLDDLFAYFSGGEVDAWKDDAYGAPQTTTNPPFDELFRPYSLYNWELGFHAPMAIVDRLLQNQQFDQALNMIHNVFDPLATGTDASRSWKWPPFKDMHSLALQSSVQRLFDTLQPGQPEPSDGVMDGPINAWRKNPFSPHVVARLRPTAYMKFVVMKYINILIAHGDYFFRQNTLEMIPIAIQCYVLASHIYGKPAQKIPKRGDKQIQTYRSLLDKWDAFSNAMVQMEVLFPFSINQIPVAVGVTSGVVGLANIFGFAATQYFCLPDNPELSALRATIDDRLFKIRHCQDIKGVERKLPLYEPPIDPGLLVVATAAGLSLSSVLNDLNSPLPNFRFKPLLRQALEMCCHLKDLGRALVVAKERKDGEALLALKQTHEGTVHGLVMEQKKLAHEEANKTVDALQQSRKAPEYRMKHNLQLLGEDLGTIPSIGDLEGEFKELADKIEAPVVESGMKLIMAEKEELKKVAEALNLKPMINAIETAASELHVLPVLNAHASPFGVGLATCFGPPNIAKGIQGAAKAYQAVSEFLHSQSAKISRVQNFARTTQARVKEANSTGHEIKKIDKQIVTHQVRVAVHEADMAAQEKTMVNSQEMQEFLTSKYTNAELYTWVDQQTSDLYYRTYTAAYDLAKKAERAFRYERGLPETKDPPPFIKFGYWEPSNSGLLCGERLTLDLRQLEAAYHATRGHDYEVTKHVSLRAVNPLQLLRLRGDAIAEFAVPEILFDMDFPGHYGRRLKSAAVTIRSHAANISPYDNFNATLQLTSHTFRNSSLVKGASDYPQKTDGDDDRFSAASHVPIDAIATSTPVADTGVFELDFSDGAERFLPFEGAGAISTWRLELNNTFRGFDYGAVDDVIVTLRYTALEGGRRLRDAANSAVSDYIKNVADLNEKEGLFAAFDVPRDFPEQWAAATSAQTDGNSSSGVKKLVLTAMNTKLPAYAKGHAPERIQTRDVWVATDKMVAPGDVSITQGSNVLAFNRADGKLGNGDGSLSALHSTDGPVVLKDWEVGLGPSVTGIQEMWILVRYSLKP